MPIKKAESARPQQGPKQPAADDREQARRAVQMSMDTRQ